ncbi:MAG: hypothetical protein WD063_11480 [Pirellulales bacterium]
MAQRAIQTELLRQAATDEARLAAADAAREAGDIRRATVFYRSLAYKKPPSEQSQKAKDALAQLQEEGRKRLGEINYEITTGDVAEAFARLRQLARDFDTVPEIGGEIRSHLNKARRRDEVAAVLNEPDAKEFWTRGQEHERKGAMCCAYLTYEEAQKLAPAPSALKAKARFDELSGDAPLVKSAEQCRNLQQCHRTYRRAERLVEARPVRAAELFKEVLDKAPHDAEIHVAARKQLAALDGSF